MAERNRKRTKHISTSELLQGILDVSRTGTGYVSVTGYQQDFIVKPNALGNAMKGDTVEIQILPGRKSVNRAEAVITRVLVRSMQRVLGTVRHYGDYAFVVPSRKQFNQDIYLSERYARNLSDGDKVMVEIIDWGDRDARPKGKVIEIFQSHQVNDMAMKEILANAGFPLIFPSEVIQEVMELKEGVYDDTLASERIDMRSVLTFTIDPADARDFDDALSIQLLQNNIWEVGVHIADVTHYVKEGSAIDQEAFRRATSVYLPDRVLPMLPERLSNEICSLRPHEDKFCFSVIFTLNQEAQVLSHTIAKTCIHSDQRYTYEEIQSILEGAADSNREVVLQLHEFAQKFRTRKFEEGAIDFASEEVRFVLDEHGVPVDVILKESKASHQLIEEWMLLANKTVTEYVSSIRVHDEVIPFPYRVHDYPDQDKLKQFARFAAKYGYKMDLSNTDTIAKSFNELIRQSEKHPKQWVLQTLGIRTMAKAVYATENIGHYGLGFKNYSHFTSPIRRYPDILSHRIIYACLKNKIQPITNLDEQCRHCSERERKAMEAEREAIKYKQIEYMQQFVGDEFEALISGIGSQGCWAITLQQHCEGFIPVQQLSGIDDFRFVEEDFTLLGRFTQRRLTLGQMIRVKVISANLDNRALTYDICWPGKVLRSIKSKKRKN